MSHIQRPTGTYLHHIRHHLLRGGLIAYPTEGSYGLGCLPKHTQGLKKVIRLKKRPQHKGLIVIGSQLKQLNPLIQPLASTEKAQLATIWPAAKTFLLPAKHTILPILRGHSRYKLAVRIPNLQRARFLCQQVKSALVSTSCNRAGKKSCQNEREVSRQFGKKVLIIGGKTGMRKQPSEIIDWETKKRLR